MLEDDQGQGGSKESVSGPRSSSLLVAVVALALAAAGVMAGYAFHQQSAAKQMAAQNAGMSATVVGLRNQLDALTTRLNEISATRAPVPAVQPAAPPEAARRAKQPTQSLSDKRYRLLQARLDAQQKELKDTEVSVTKTRSDLESSLDRAKGELNGTIAKNHDELVALEKRGERNYFEFDLTKSKQFQRTGGISISLRHTDTKYMNYDVVVLVDDNQLVKKRVDLYEPIWFDRADDPEPLELVVNKVDKNHVHGYVSTPRFRNSELAAMNRAGARGETGAGSTASTPSASKEAQPAATPEDQNPNTPLEHQQ
jgi:hypothetical protein